MSGWAQHPLFAAVAWPFVAGLVAAELFNRLRLSGLAVAAGVAVALHFAGLLPPAPADLTGRLGIVTLVAALVGAVLSLAGGPGWMRIPLALAAGSAAIWAAWPHLLPQPMLQVLIYGGAVAAYVAWQTVALDGLSEQAPRAAAAGIGLGLGTGIGAWIVGATFAAKIALAAGAACVAYQAIIIVAGQWLPCRRAFTLTLGVATGLAGAAAMLGGSLPWLALPVLALIPLAARVPLPRAATLRWEAIGTTAATLAIGSAAILAARHGLPKLPL